MSGGNNRLSEPKGLLLDRTKRIEFAFEGKAYTGFSGDTIASALAANGQWILSRSFKYHRPRGVLSMAGHDANALVQVGHEPNVPADTFPISDGLKIWGQNYSGSLENDRDAILGRLSRFLPVGFYYRTFFRPGRHAWTKLWEPMIRRKSGLGRIEVNSVHKDQIYDKMHLFKDVVVVGGGPAGLAAALAAGEAGAEVLLVEESPVLGGALTYARTDAPGLIAAKERRSLIDAVNAASNIEIMTGAVCNGWFADNWLPVIRGNRLNKVRAKEVIVAAGCIEQPAQFRNNDLPGIMLGSAAQRLIGLYGVRPGTEAVVLTANTDGYGVALDLADAGVKVAAVIDLRVAGSASDLAQAVAGRGIAVTNGHCVLEAVGARGGRHLQRVLLAPIGRGGEAAQGTRWIDCDLLCMSIGYMPAYQLPLQAGARLQYSEDDTWFSITNVPQNMQVAGAINGAFGIGATLADGRRAGLRAAKALGLAAGPEPFAESGRNDQPVNYPWPIFPHPKGKEFVDFDEDLQIRDILNTVAEGYSEIELVKRFSTVGMGPSQGRHSALATARLVAKATNRSIAEVGVTTARPPLGAEKLGVLAGRDYRFERLTPMHDRHVEAGAQMSAAGAWRRPAYYGSKRDKEGRIREEVLAVRQGAAILDVSTSGRFEIRGPDAAEFVDRIHASAHKTQAIGDARYLLRTNEMGSILDDGIACRLGDEHFYLTCSTGSASAAHEMLRLNSEWQLDVDIAEVTAAYAAVTLAGPRARAVLAKVVEDLEISGEAFPFMSVRLAKVAGIPARILRSGATGELSYELHVPASMGEALWDRLMDAGRTEALRPYGLNASNILRIEKGHVVIGQDTDVMSTPDEVGLDWAVSREKTFFVGSRSMELRSSNPLKRKLVGFAMEDPAAPSPEESCLVLRDKLPVGRVTSVCRSPALGQVIGLAYTAAEEAHSGAPIRFRLRSGGMVEGRVTSRHFHAPQNKPQEM